MQEEWANLVPDPGLMVSSERGLEGHLLIAGGGASGFRSVGAPGLSLKASLGRNRAEKQTRTRGTGKIGSKNISFDAGGDAGSPGLLAIACLFSFVK